MVYIDKVVNITQAHSIKSKREYEAELNRYILHKQSCIDRLIKELQSIEIDDKTANLMTNIFSVILANWRVGKFKEEHIKQLTDKQKANKPKRRA